ncbi:glycosyl transferase family 90-domain-containing protein [Dunaliella salina]|uniref:Glycosyl transferase family 90-domain-containing protein n=1 Tax=Dunaliella salina TaxID=3046 RepID=A0ABQ7GMV3_DUNSA|nr:glycosyl transferase family 90-domain-containing protein [Dunaliella salina]|eukprot:KAF5835937.1 glycosyl transferase family 90-domain-containing protein [Dunaliella salina]
MLSTFCRWGKSPAKQTPNVGHAPLSLSGPRPSCYLLAASQGGAASAGTETTHGEMQLQSHYSTLRNPSRCKTLKTCKLMCSLDFRSNNGNYGKTSRPLPMFYYSRTALREPGFLLPYKFTFLDLSRHRNAFVDVPWSKKISKGIFRGATSCGTYATNTWRSMPRTQLVWACRNRTDVCDGGFSKWAQITEGAKKAMEEEFHGLLPHVPMREYSRYKYIIVPDGNTAPTSRMATFFSNSAVIKQVTPVKEFFYSNLQPYVHYIPLSYKMTDIASVLDWARANDGLAAAIARNARSWALMYLNNECVANYMKDVFDSYARIMAPDFVPGSSGFPYKEIKLNPRVATYLGRRCAGLKGPCGSMNRQWQGRAGGM